MAVQALNQNNRVGGLGIYGNTASDEIKAQNAKLQSVVDTLTAQLKDAGKTPDLSGLKTTTS
jgi:hypothetical protein